MTKDPVCGMNVDENNSQYQTQYGGKKFNFCSEQCKKKFDQQPEQYARSVSAAKVAVASKQKWPRTNASGATCFKVAPRQASRVVPESTSTRE